ncbi:hypothetical protein JCM1841_004080 [Sporobolomyces salmonicolor]
MSDVPEWQPAPGESPADREKRLKREKRAAFLAGQNGGAAAPASANGSAMGGSSGAPARDYGEWVPPPGESPEEREKRIKREKRAARMAEQNGSAGGAPSFAQNGHAGEWQPPPGESPAEREKRIKREKRAAYLAAQGLAPAPEPTSGFIPPPAALSGPPPALAEAGQRTIHPSRAEAVAALARETGDKKSKHAQSMTPARQKYLKRKKDRAKGRKAAQPKGASRGDSVSREGSAAASIVGGKRKRDDGDDGSDDEEGEEADNKSEVSPEDKAAKEAKIAQLKAARKEARLAKKAEAKRIKAEGGVLPPPKPRVVPAPKPATTTPVRAPSPESAEPTEEELAKQKEREEIEARKAAKRQKREQRRFAVAEPSEAADDTSTAPLIPTAPSAPVPRSRSPTPVHDMPLLAGASRLASSMDVDSAAPAAPATVESDAAAAPAASPPAALLRLPSATRPAPPSAKTLSSLNVHESVRDKQVVDPLRKVEITQEIGGDGTGVGERGRKRLRGEMGVEEWFAVQTAVVPLLLPPSSQPPALYAPFDPPRDICVSAPTGSGKTLSYVVPIVEALQHRLVTRLRALVLLPTRDLVGQVRETFEAFAKGTRLKVGVATGQHSFAHEQAVLVGENFPEIIQGGSSQVDILIATPGRLMDHLKATKGFSLQHLRFFVVDEADRLLTQSFHDWLPTILAALKPSPTLSSESPTGTVDLPEQADALAPVWWDAEGKPGRVASDVDERCAPSCQKLLFSATLSRDPAKIDALHLHRPIYISVEDALDPHAEDEAMDSELKFTFPAELTEHMIISPSSHKPLYLFHLLHTLSISSALCFTKSVEAATRLAKLVEFFEEARRAETGEGSEDKRVVVKAYSSELAPNERKKVLKEFKQGETQMLICSDLISRGIDIANVSHVISYDIPTDMRKYVHRVGRTARAGHTGEAWSLVEDQEVAPFKAIMSSAQHWQKIDRVRVKDNLVEPFVPPYQVALERLRLHFSTSREKERSTTVA